LNGGGDISVDSFRPYILAATRNASIDLEHLEAEAVGQVL
jgi:hypothetical protein